MKVSRIFLFMLIISVIALIVGCSKLSQIKGSISGTVFRDGRPIMGQIQVLNPKTLGSVKTEPVNNAGHFIIADVPPGEYLLAFLGPTSAPIGEYMYVKVVMGRPETGIVFEITEKDPKVTELMDKIKAEGGAGGATGANTGK